MVDDLEMLKQENYLLCEILVASSLLLDYYINNIFDNVKICHGDTFICEDENHEKFIPFLLAKQQECIMGIDIFTSNYCDDTIKYIGNKISIYMELLKEEVEFMDKVVQVRFTKNLPDTHPCKGVYELVDKNTGVCYDNRLVLIEYNVDKIMKEYRKTGKSDFEYVVMLCLEGDELKKFVKGDYIKEEFYKQKMKLMNCDLFKDIE